MARRFVYLACFIILISSIYVSANEPRFSADSDTLYRNDEAFSYLPNPQASEAFDPIFDSTYFPILTDWRDEVYVSDSTWGFLHPKIIPDGSVLHVFGDGIEIGSPPRRPIHFQSTDDGGTWTLFGNYYNPDLSGMTESPDAWGEGATLYACWRGQRGDDPAFIHFRSSPDRGATWPITAELRYATPYFDARYGVVAGRGDTAFVNFIQYGANGLACWRSFNRGLTWANPGYIDTAWGQSYPARMTYQGGVLHIVHNKDWDGHTDVFYLRSTNRGYGFSEPVLLGFPDGNHGQWPEIAADSLGNVAVCWMDYIGSPYAFTGGAWVRQSSDFGASWGEALRLDTNYEASVGMGVAVQGNYRAVAWVDLSGLGSRVVLRESQDGGQSWGSAQVMGEGICYDPRLAMRGEAAYLVWLESVYVGGDARGTIRFRKNDAAVGIAWSEVVELPRSIALSAHPNPFNFATTITVAGIAEAEIAIYDITGRRVATLHAANGRAVWWAEGLSSGVYFARAVSKGAANVIKLVYLK